ncbi:exodeoxyribonuclease VII large subunit [Steroidobacter sp.]|uniref:exodeoxyribonuclease VII large subunit n=1 Tax=Steroidobacter sp. TaxID=1978227 RepID=UPI001A3F2BD1|nr:exodeoxyribonuclease VII large subunit [Steroidobacter sp.]MBL8265425.1 exodeoxyribonuclease VII large subunit [Steroidobacter sp.]
MNRELEFDFSPPAGPKPAAAEAPAPRPAEPAPEAKKAATPPTRKPARAPVRPPVEETDPPAEPTQPERDVYTPGRLNKEARMLLERGLPSLWLEGEISNLSRPSSGHWYFSLKDESAQLRCAMFRQKNMGARFTPKDGMHVLTRGRVSLYEPRGDYQFIADHMEEAGEGVLRRRFELLKTKLAAEGLFDAARKRGLPRLPKRIGVVTSPTGAAVRDVLNILRRRFCSIPVLIYPVQVQGATAAGQIAATIRLASARAECDVLIVARGGGSLEDLWAFNEEVVARAIFDCAIPVVSGVGHEVDFTIADFVADVRAPTPSGAAELVAPDCNEWTRSVALLGRRARTAMVRNLAARQQRLVWLERRLAQVHPGVELRQKAQRLDDLEQRLSRCMRHGLFKRRSSLVELAAHLRQRSPALRVAAARGRLDIARKTLGTSLQRRVSVAESRLRHAASNLRQHSPVARIAALRRRVEIADKSMETTLQRQLRNLEARFKLAAGKLNTVSPLATLQRGYAIVTDANGTVVTDAAPVKQGDMIETRLAHGSLRARVEQVVPHRDDEKQ